MTKPKRIRRKRCDLCSRLYDPGPHSLKGICSDCSDKLNGGVYAAAGKRELMPLLRKRDAGGLDALEADHA